MSDSVERRLALIAEALGSHYGPVRWSVVDTGRLRTDEQCGVLINVSEIVSATDTLGSGAWHTVAGVLLAHEWAHVGQLRGIPARERSNRRRLECAADLLGAFQLPRLWDQLSRAASDSVHAVRVLLSLSGILGERSNDVTARYPTPEVRQRCLLIGLTASLQMRGLRRAETLSYWSVDFDSLAAWAEATERHLYGPSSDPLRWSLERARTIEVLFLTPGVEPITEEVLRNAEEYRRSEPAVGVTTLLQRLIDVLRDGEGAPQSFVGPPSINANGDTTGFAMRLSLGYPWQCYWYWPIYTKNPADGTCFRSLQADSTSAVRVARSIESDIRAALRSLAWREERVLTRTSGPFTNFRTVLHTRWRPDGDKRGLKEVELKMRQMGSASQFTGTPWFLDISFSSRGRP